MVLAKINLSGRIINASLLNFFSIVSTLGISILSKILISKLFLSIFLLVINIGSLEYEESISFPNLFFKEGNIFPLLGSFEIPNPCPSLGFNSVHLY